MLSMVAHSYSANRALCDSVRCITVPSVLLIDADGFRFIVTLGWIMGKPLTLLFDPLESIVMFLSGECLLNCR